MGAPLAIATDPDVEAAGSDVGYKLDERTLRAPDFAVGNVPREPGWVAGAPALAVEYADTGQDEDELRLKIEEFFRAGTKYVWVVRLTGVQRVEVHARGRKMRLVTAGHLLEAPGILRNAVPVEALYDRDAAFRAVLHNLIQRQGYESFEAALAGSRVAARLMCFSRCATAASSR